MKDALVRDFWFQGDEAPPVVASGDGGYWRSKITKTAGSPTVRAAAGVMALTLDNANEVQNLCLYGGDSLGFKIDRLLAVEIFAAITASVPAAVSCAFGVASTRNDTLDTVTAAAWFRLNGNNNLLLESDDNVNDVNTIATGLTLPTTIQRHVIQFDEGVQTISPPSQSKGGKANVLFSIENGRGQLRRVGQTQLFDMSNYTGGFQLFAQLQKTAAASVATLSIERFRVHYRVA